MERDDICGKSPSLNHMWGVPSMFQQRSLIANSFEGPRQGPYAARSCIENDASLWYKKTFRE